MWSRLEAPRTADDLISELRSKFPSLSESDAARDVAAFLAELSEHRMVSVEQ